MFFSGCHLGPSGCLSQSQRLLRQVASPLHICSVDTLSNAGPGLLHDDLCPSPCRWDVRDCGVEGSRVAGWLYYLAAASKAAGGRVWCRQAACDASQASRLAPLPPVMLPARTCLVTHTCVCQCCLGFCVCMSAFCFSLDSCPAAGVLQQHMCCCAAPLLFPPDSAVG